MHRHNGRFITTAQEKQIILDRFILDTPLERVLAKHDITREQFATLKIEMVGLMDAELAENRAEIDSGLE